MTNLLQFPYPSYMSKQVSKDLVMSDLFPHKVQVIWSSLLGETNKEIVINYLIKSKKFSSFVIKTKMKFLKDPKKFPSMKNSDWEE